MSTEQNHYAEIWEIAESIAETEGFDVVSLDIKGSQGRPHVTVVLHKEDGVTVGDCQHFNDLLGARLELEDHIFPDGYYLEVSTPGLDRTLEDDREFDIFRGRTVHVNTYAPVHEKKDFIGALEGLCDGDIVVTLPEGTTYRIPREMVARAKLHYEL